MATVATIIENSLQAGGLRRVTAEWVSDGGTTRRNTRKVDDATNVQAFVDSLIPSVEADWKQAEKEAARDFMYLGGDPDSLTLEFNTQDEMRQFCIRSAANLLRDGDFTMVTEAINSSPYVDKFSGGQLAGWLEGANVGQANGWKSFLNGLRTTLVTYVPGFPEQEFD